MSDDIVTRLEQKMDFVEYLRLWASVDTNDQAVRDLHKAADEIERLRTMLSELANRFSAQEAKHYRIIRSLEAERDQWQQQAINRG